MIASISGKVIQLTKETVIIDINGLGIEVFVPKPLLGETEAGDLLYLLSGKTIFRFTDLPALKKSSFSCNFSL